MWTNFEWIGVRIISGTRLDRSLTLVTDSFDVAVQSALEDVRMRGLDVAPSHRAVGHLNHALSGP